MGKPREINLFGALVKRGEERVGSKRFRGKAVIKVVSPELTFLADEEGLAEDVAKALTAVFRINMLSGKTPGGEPLPAVAPATAQRRAQRREQAARNGAPHPRWRDPQKIAQVNKNWKKRFSAAKLGNFLPNPTGTSWFGVESGMLAFSALARPANPGWEIYFAGPRATLGKRGGDSAVMRVFGRIGAFSPNVLNQPIVQKALVSFAKTLFADRVKRAMLEAKKAVENVNALGQDLASTQH